MRHARRRSGPRSRPFEPATVERGPCSRRGDPARDSRRVLRVGGADEHRCRRARHRHPQVEPVPQRPRDPPRVAIDLADRAPATILGHRPGEPARARVHRSHELEACREGHDPAGPRDGDPALLQRLTERLEDVPIELGQLVEEKHALMGPRDLARGQGRSTTDHGRVGQRVVRRAERRLPRAATRSVPRRPPTPRSTPTAPPRRRAAEEARGSSAPAASCPRPAARSAAGRARRLGRSRVRGAPRAARAPPPGRARMGPCAVATGRAPRSAEAPAGPVIVTRGIATGTRRGRRPRTSSAASARLAAPTTSIPSTRRPSSTADGATTTRPIRRSASAATIGRMPGTGRTSPSRPSSPRRATGSGPARTCSEPRRIPMAMARSSDAPVLRSSAGARLTVRRRGGKANPAFRIAPRTRSRASCTAVSPRPTTVKPGRPGATSTSTRMDRPSRPCKRGGRDDGQHAGHPTGGRSPQTYRAITRAHHEDDRRAAASRHELSISERRPVAPGQPPRPCRRRARTAAATRRAANRPS